VSFVRCLSAECSQRGRGRDGTSCQRGEQSHHSLPDYRRAAACDGRRPSAGQLERCHGTTQVPHVAAVCW